MAREAAERVVLTLTRENVCANIVSTPSLEIFDDRHANNIDARSRGGAGLPDR